MKNKKFFVEDYKFDWTVFRDSLLCLFMAFTFISNYFVFEITPGAIFEYVIIISNAVVGTILLCFGLAFMIGFFVDKIKVKREVMVE